MAEHKVLGILLALGLCLVAGVFFLIDTEDTTTAGKIGASVAVTPAPEDEQAGSSFQPVTGAALPSNSPLAGKVLVSRRPVKVLAAPDPTASELYGFPAGRPFRALAKQDGFIRIQDVRSGASGWIDEAALAPAPAQIRAGDTTGGSAAPGPSRNRATSYGSAPPKRTTSAPPVQKKRSSGGLFGRNGPLRGLFGN